MAKQKESNLLPIIVSEVRVEIPTEQVETTEEKVDTPEVTTIVTPVEQVDTPEVTTVVTPVEKVDTPEVTTVDTSEDPLVETAKDKEAYIKGAIDFIHTNARRDAFEAARRKEQDESSLLTKEDTVRIAKQNAANRLQANKEKQAELVAIQEAEAAKKKEKK